MTGLIWFVQVVHYPLFARVGAEGFAAYHAAHARGTTLVVAAPMIVELAAAGSLALRPVVGVPSWLSWAGFALALAVWGSTMAVQVPLHERLSAGFDGEAHAALVVSNVFRAVLWTGHALVATCQLSEWAAALQTAGRG
jgi:hypothetical protein